MATTVNALAVDLILEGGEQPDFARTQVFEGWVIQAVDQLLADGIWPFSMAQEALVTSVGVGEYTLSASAADVQGIFRATDDTFLQRTEQRTMRRLGADYDATGTPSHWYPTGADSSDPNRVSIRLWKAPDAVITYTVFYNNRADGLASADTIPLPDDALRAVRHLVREYYRENKGDYAGADRARGRYLATLQRLKDRYESPQALRSTFQVRDLSRPTSLSLNLPENIVE